jgi:hypothetical protein
LTEAFDSAHHGRVIYRSALRVLVIATFLAALLVASDSRAADVIAIYLTEQGVPFLPPAAEHWQQALTNLPEDILVINADGHLGGLYVGKSPTVDVEELIRPGTPVDQVITTLETRARGFNQAGPADVREILERLRCGSYRRVLWLACDVATPGLPVNKTIPGSFVAAGLGEEHVMFRQGVYFGVVTDNTAEIPLIVMDHHGRTFSLRLGRSGKPASQVIKAPGLGRSRNSLSDSWPELGIYQRKKGGNDSILHELRHGTRYELSSISGRFGSVTKFGFSTIVEAGVPLSGSASKYGAPAFVGAMFLQDQIEAHPDSDLAHTAQAIGVAADWADWATLRLVSTVSGKADRGASNLLTLGIMGPEKASEYWAARESAYNTPGPSMRAAPEWYQMPAGTWPRMLWKSGFGIKTLVHSWYASE